ncbi:MAG TPA: hypothetical protein VK207_07170 [Bacteroidales bacterium]|nr:hypothetical protein [Bacteroidales bacterium]
MSSATEKGNASNLANFNELITSVIAIGPDYVPANNILTVQSMKSQSLQCRSAMDRVITSFAAFKAAVDSREQVFDQMNRHISRILNTLKSSDVPAATIETCKSIARRLQGKRAVPKRTLEEVQADKAAGIEYIERSSSQRSYDNQVENFALLLEQLISVPGYKPNEKELQTDFLKTLLSEMRQKNAEVMSARLALKDARLQRNEVMYREGTGIVPVAMSVKAYVKGAFGQSSAHFKKISPLSFRKR